MRQALLRTFFIGAFAALCAACGRAKLADALRHHGVPFAAGGPMDTVGRIMAASLSDTLGQSVIVENVGGGGGIDRLGARRESRARRLAIRARQRRHPCGRADAIEEPAL